MTDETTYAEVVETREQLPELTREELEALYQQCLDEGHLIHSESFAADLESESWAMFCSCGASSAFTGPDNMPSDEPLRLLTFVEARWWARGHRTEHGLEWQSRIQNTTGRLLGLHYAAEGHCVTALYAPEITDTPDRWFAVCTCGFDSDEEIQDGVHAQRASTFDVVKWWADEHRLAHDLEPQELLPTPPQIYNLEDVAGESVGTVRGLLMISGGLVVSPPE